MQEPDSVNLVEPSLDKNPSLWSQDAVNQSVELILDNVKDLKVSERNRLRSLLKNWSDVISVGDGDLGRSSVLHHKINTGDAPPIRQQACRLPFHQRDMVQKMVQGMYEQDMVQKMVQGMYEQDMVQKMVQGMYEQGIIEPSESAWASPIVLVKKD